MSGHVLVLGVLVPVVFVGGRGFVLLGAMVVVFLGLIRVGLGGVY